MAQISNHLSGIGIQNSGVFNVQGNVNIGAAGSGPDKVDEALKALRVTDPAADKVRIEREKGQLRRECYEWVLGTDEFREWHTGNEQQVLWIKGDAGKGKTMLLCGIIDQLEQLPEPETRCVAYFFCQATHASLNNAVNALRGLLYGILAKNRHLAVHLAERFEHSGQKVFEDINAWDSLSSILLEVLTDPSLPSNTFLVVDGLDECSTGMSELLDLFQRISTQTKVRLLLSSRKWLEISEGLAQSNGLESLNLELNRTHVSQAVKAFIEFKVADLSEKKKYSPALRQTVHQHLTENSNATFLWVALVCQELNDKKLRNVMVPKRLGRFPAGLQEFYNRMMEDILASDYTDYCRQILEAVAVTYRPLSTAELACLVESPEDFEEEGWLDEVIELCRSLIVRREDSSVSFVHQSAKDFLVNYQAMDGYPSLGPEQHAVILERSFGTMDQVLRRNMYRLPHPGASVTSEPGSEDPLAPCRYSCVFWVEHLLEILHEESPTHVRNLVEDDGLAHEFLMRHFPHWIESLALLKSIMPGVFSLARLDHRLEQLQDSLGIPKFAKFVANATRLGQSYRHVLELAPLQVYMSAYAFIPMDARQDLFDGEVPQTPSWISHARGTLEEGWSPRKMDIMPLTENPQWRDYAIRDLSISPDGKWIAAILLYEDKTEPWSWHSTIRIWDAKTGHCEGAIDHECDSITFSSDGDHLASVGCDSIIKVWNVATTECLGTLDTTERSQIMAVAFYKHGKNVRLVSLAANDEITHWDWTIKNCERSRLLGRENHSHPPKDFREDDSDYEPKSASKAAMFDRGESIAILDIDFGLQSLTLSIWASGTGRCEHIVDLLSLQHFHDYFDDFKYLKDYVIAGASHEQRIAVGFRNTIHVFDVTKPHDPLLLQIHRGKITSLIFNESGSRLVAATWSHIDAPPAGVQMWNVQTLACELAVPGNRASISSAEPSIMIINSPPCLLVWDVSISGIGRALGSALDVHDMALSDDLSRAVSISTKENHIALDSQIQIWETNSGRCLEKIDLEGILASMDSVIFNGAELSRDLRLAAIHLSLHDRRFIRVFDIKDRRLRCNIPLPEDAGYPAIAFSSCGDLMVTATQVMGLGYMLSVWTTDTGHFLSDQIISEEMPKENLAMVCSQQMKWAGVFGPSMHDQNQDVALHTSVPARYCGRLHHGDKVRAAAFTSDWLMLATGSRDGTVKLWDTVTGNCTGSVDLKRGYLPEDCRLSFSGPGLELSTPWGLIDLGSLVRPSGVRKDHDGLPVLRGYASLGDPGWIHRNGMPFLWIPPADLPSSGVSLVLKDSTIAIYSRSGEFYFCHLPDERQEMSLGN